MIVYLFGKDLDVFHIVLDIGLHKLLILRNPYIYMTPYNIKVEMDKAKAQIYALP